MKLPFFISALPLLTICIGLNTMTFAQTPASKAETDFYIGTYTEPGKSEGIYRASLNNKTGAISIKGLAAKIESPSFLTLHPNGKYLYAATETAQSTVAAFQIEENGNLLSAGSESSKGSGNCHVVVDPSGKNVLASNYGSGSFVCIPINPSEGSLRYASSFIELTKKDRSPNGHAMAVLGEFAYGCDLGSNEVTVYNFDAENGKLTPHEEQPSVQLPPGSGPRHLVFHPNQKHLYVNNEMNSSVTVFSVDKEKGLLKEIQTLPTLPADAGDVKNSTAEIACDTAGKFIYVSNRGHDSIAVFQIGADGKLSVVEHAPTKAQNPRAFVIDPSGKWMVVGGHKSDNITVHQIDPKTGKLTFVSEATGIHSPVSFQFVNP